MYTVAGMKASLQVQTPVAEYPDTNLSAGCPNTFIT